MVFFLTRDTETGRVFVTRGWAHRHGQVFDTGHEDVLLAEVWRLDGAAQDRLMALLGTLVPA